MVIKKTKKALLGFATTTSLILLVMVAPATTTATASLQREDNATTTIDEPNNNIPIEPPAARDEEEEPDEPIPPDNENNTGGIEEPPIAKEPIGPANETNNGGNNGTIMCPANIKREFQTDKKTYKQGEDVIVTGSANAGGRVWGNDNTPVEVRYKGPEDASYVSNEVQPEYSDCSFSYTFVLKNVQQAGMWEVSAVYPPGDDGEVIGKTQFEVYPGQGIPAART